MPEIIEALALIKLLSKLGNNRTIGSITLDEMVDLAKKIIIKKHLDELKSNDEPPF